VTRSCDPDMWDQHAQCAAREAAILQSAKGKPRAAINSAGPELSSSFSTTSRRLQATPTEATRENSGVPIRDQLCQA
jgi:hypothetical protein